MSMFSLLVSTGYILMAIAQRYGPEVIEVLHGKEAKQKATAVLQYDDVKADRALQELCDGYDAHHYDPVSNCLHAAGMILGIISILSFLISRKGKILVTVFPIWYLYAWVGHFFLQKDIPAVFVYGMTLQGLLFFANPNPNLSTI